MRGLEREPSRAARVAGLAFVCAGLLVSGIETRALAQPAPDAPAADAPGTKTKKTTTKATKTASKKTSQAKKKKAPRAPVDATVESSSARRRRIGAQPAYVVGDSDAHLINQNAPPIVPFPNEAGAVKKAFAETRRDQLVDAEKAARDEKSPDRWRTVLFMLRGLPDRTDPEACFWRVLSFYRLAELSRARKVREGCDLPGKDSVVLNAEDATAAGIPEMGAISADDDTTSPTRPPADKPAAPPPPATPPGAQRYTGPSPQRYQ